MQPAALTNLGNSTWSFSQRYWRLVVIAMLLLLHVAAVRGVSDPWARALLLAHLGLLLLWQPFLSVERRVSPAQAAVLALGAVAVMLWLDWWLLAFWVVVLTGLVGGKVYQQDARWQRRVYLVVLVYLMALLAIIILPEVAPRREITGEVRQVAEYALPLLFVLIALFPAERDTPDTAQVIDFFYSVFVMLLLVVVILGSFTLMTLGRSGYLQALSSTVLLIGAAVLLIGLAWSPRGGVAGLNVFVSRYLFSIGLPLEKWLHILAELSQLEARPERFLDEAVAALVRLPWVAGAVWSAGEARGEKGQRTADVVEFRNEELWLSIHSRYRLSPALEWHLRLIGQLLGEFYLAKLREEQLRQASYLQAVHETGARMTHDIKNLLQSLNVLCSVAAREENRDSAELQALFRRQLPVIAQRLSDTLEKLQRPQDSEESFVSAVAWWDAFLRQYRGEEVDFAASAIPAGLRLPRTLFDTVADNLVRNALAKRAIEGRISVRVLLECGDYVALKVCDSGSAVPEDLAGQLLRSPVASSGGLGIGLYQAAQLAKAGGWTLALESNRDGEVCFALTGPAG